MVGKLAESPKKPTENHENPLRLMDPAPIGGSSRQRRSGPDRRGFTLRPQSLADSSHRSWTIYAILHRCTGRGSRFCRRWPRSASRGRSKVRMCLPDMFVHQARTKCRSIARRLHGLQDGGPIHKFKPEPRHEPNTKNETRSGSCAQISMYRSTREKAS